MYYSPLDHSHINSSSLGMNLQFSGSILSRRCFHLSCSGYGPDGPDPFQKDSLWKNYQAMPRTAGSALSGRRNVHFPQLFYLHKKNSLYIHIKSLKTQLSSDSFPRPLNQDVLIVELQYILICCHFMILAERRDCIHS